MAEFIFDICCVAIAGCIAFFLVRGVREFSSPSDEMERIEEIAPVEQHSDNSNTINAELGTSSIQIKRQHLGLKIGAVSDFKTVEAAVRSFLGEEIVSRVVDEGDVHDFRFASKGDKEFGYGGGRWQMVSVLLSGNRIMTISFDKGFKDQDMCQKEALDILQGITDKYGNGQPYEGNNRAEMIWDDGTSQMNFKVYHWESPTLPWHVKVSYSDIKLLKSASSALEF